MSLTKILRSATLGAAAVLALNAAAPKQAEAQTVDTIKVIVRGENIEEYKGLVDRPTFVESFRNLWARQLLDPTATVSLRYLDTAACAQTCPPGQEPVADSAAKPATPTPAARPRAAPVVRPLNEIAVRNRQNGNAIILTPVNNFTGEIIYTPGSDECFGYDARPATQLYEGITRGAQGEAYARVLERDTTSNHRRMGGEACAKDLVGTVELDAVTTYQGARRTSKVTFRPRAVEVVTIPADTQTSEEPRPVEKRAHIPTIPRTNTPNAESSSYLSIGAGGLGRTENMVNGMPRVRDFKQSHAGVYVQAQGLLDTKLFLLDGSVVHQRYNGNQTSDNTANSSEMTTNNTLVNLYGIANLPFGLGIAVHAEHERTKLFERLFENEAEPLRHTTTNTNATSVAVGPAFHRGPFSAAAMYAQRRQPKGYSWDEKQQGGEVRFDFNGPRAGKKYSFGVGIEHYRGKEAPVGIQDFDRFIHANLRYQLNSNIGLELGVSQHNADGAQQISSPTYSAGIDLTRLR